MPQRRKFWLWIAVAATLSMVAVALFIVAMLRRPISITGVVTVQDKDPRKQLPIADVVVSAANGAAYAPAKSNDTGMFTLKLHKWIRKGHPVTLKFRHPGYRALDLKEVADDKLYVARMDPVVVKKAERVPAIAIGNLRVRYSMKASRAMNVGSAVETFQAKNVGNVPCKGQPPCSPDGKWKAGVGSASLDAGMGNEFRNARVSCIAGPCPFTKIETEGLSTPSQHISATARSWSDTATFLVEAEVVHVMQSDIDHQLYPVIFGSALNFTLPANAEGVCLEADMGGETIIFPLGPTLFLSWADCNAVSNPDRTNLYRCELKPGYRFQ